MRPPTEVIIDVGKDLSLLNTYLDEAWTPEVHERARITDKRLAELREILLDLHEHHRRAVGTSNGILHSPMLQQNSSDYENSPQQVLRSVLNNFLRSSGKLSACGQLNVEYVYGLLHLDLAASVICILSWSPRFIIFCT